LDVPDDAPEEKEEVDEFRVWLFRRHHHHHGPLRDQYR